MAKAKKVLSTVLVALFTVFTVLSYVPAQTTKAAAAPKVNLVAKPNAEYKVGDRVLVKFNAGTYKGIVQYRAFLWKVGYGKVKELYPDYAKDSYFYKPVCVGTSTFTIDVFYATEPGTYEIVVGVKAKGAKASTASYVNTGRFTVVAKEEATAEIKSLEAVSVTVNQNDTAVLPATVKATLADGTTKDVKVTWGTVDTSKAGDVTVEGTVEGTTLKATAKVTVKAVELSVKSVAATAADKFKVVFNTVPQDTSKVVFTVKRETTPVTVTAAWNGSEATLTGSVKFAQGNYTVNVKENDKDLGTSNVTIEQEKVAKIEINSDTLAVQTVTSGGTTNQYAYFTYKVFNQYDVDITDTSLASINWIVPSCTVIQNSKGIVKVQATGGLNLFNLGSLTITGIEQNYNVTTSKTLKISATVGTLSDIQFVALKQADNKEFKAGSTADFYIDYVAKDMAGNETKDYTLVSNGLNTLTSSSNDYVDVSLEDNDGKAVIKVKVKVSSITVDMPILFTAVTSSGKSTSLTATLKKQAGVASFTLLAPTQDIAAGDGAKEIPFVAYDQDGNQITSFDDLVAGGVVEGYKYTTGNGFSVSPAYTSAGGTGLYFVKKSDGTAKLMYKPASTATQDTTTILTATTTTTGKYSQLSIVVRKPAVASSFTLDTSSLITKFQAGAEYDIDNGIFTIKDQYGRDMDISSSAYIRADVSATGTQFAVSDATTYSYSTTANNINDDFVVKAPATTGSYTVKFTLVKVESGTATDVTSKTVTFAVLSDSDIKGLTTGTVGKLYNVNGITNEAVNYAVYKNYVQIFGKTSSGEKVVLAKRPFDLGTSNDYAGIVNATYSGSENEISNYATTAPAYMNKIMLSTNATLPTGVTEENTVVTATTAINGQIMSVSFTVTSSVEKAVAKEISADDEITAADNVLDDISVKDQYGKNLLKRTDWASFVTVYVDGVKTTFSGNITSTTTVAQLIGSPATAAGHVITIVTHNGITKTFVTK